MSGTSPIDHAYEEAMHRISQLERDYDAAMHRVAELETLLEKANKVPMQVLLAVRKED